MAHQNKYLERKNEIDKSLDEIQHSEMTQKKFATLLACFQSPFTYPLSILYCLSLYLPFRISVGDLSF